LKLADLENQQILKEKWHQQENSKVDHTPKIINKLKNIEDGSPKVKDDADTIKRKQASDHQQVLKQRWIENEEEEKFYKQAKEQELCKSKYDVEATENSPITKETKLEKTKVRHDTCSAQHIEEDINATDVVDTSLQVLDVGCVMKKSNIGEEEKHIKAQEETPDPLVFEVLQQIPHEDDQKIVEGELEGRKNTKDNDMDTRERDIEIKLLQKEKEKNEKQRKIEAQELQKKKTERGNRKNKSRTKWKNKRNPK